MQFKPLKEWQSVFGGAIKASSLRAEVLAGRLKGIRVRPGCNAPILVSVQEMKRWLDEVAAKRRLVLSPTEAANARKAAG
ncbi:MAG: hypothetical protein IPK87_10605 [Planctomycetes bacterium]|nr:hypothetical protein [Planctomycetota bacterium]